MVGAKRVSRLELFSQRCLTRRETLNKMPTMEKEENINLQPFFLLYTNTALLRWAGKSRKLENLKLQDLEKQLEVVFLSQIPNLSCYFPQELWQECCSPSWEFPCAWLGPEGGAEPAPRSDQNLLQGSSPHG